MLCKIDQRAIIKKRKKIAGLARRKGKAYFKKKFWQELLRSTFFLTTNGTLFITCFCIWRKIAGFYFYPCAILLGAPASGISLSIERKERKLVGSFYYTNTLSFIPCLAASIIAILQERKSRKVNGKHMTNMYAQSLAFVPAAIGSVVASMLERKSRRGLLAVYMGNIATETVWRMMKARGWVKSLPNGEVLLFSVASAVYLYYFKKADGLQDGTLTIFKKIFGGDETLPAEGNIPAVDDNNDEDSVINKNGPVRKHTSVIASPAKALEPAVRWLKQCPKHGVCRHKHGCIYYILQGSVQMFGVGYAVQAGIKVLSSLGHVFKQPNTVIKGLVHKNNVQLGAFLASFVGIYRAVNCLLRWLRNKDEELHGLVAGFVAAWSMLFYKSSSIALYTASKLAEMLYFKGIASGRLPYIQCADIIIYSISTALVFHAAVLEPHNLRPAYWNFLLRVTGNRFAGMNRRLLDPWVPNCSKLYPDYWPNYDMRFTKLVKPS